MIARRSDSMDDAAPESPRRGRPRLGAFGVAWRVLLGLALVPIGLFLAFIALAVGYIENVGCFLDCSTRDPDGGSAAVLFVLAVVIAAIPPAVMALVWPRRLVAAATTVVAMLAFALAFMVAFG
jgi:hypothetical protein